MYSRRFSDAVVQPPPDYSGVAYRAGREAPPESEPEEEQIRQAAENAEKDVPLRDGAREERQADAGEASMDENERSGAERGASDDKDRGGKLLDSLFALSGRRFSAEDVILAGLILLLLSEKNGREKPDGELLFILGLLLLSK